MGESERSMDETSESTEVEQEIEGGEETSTPEGEQDGDKVDETSAE